MNTIQLIWNLKKLNDNLNELARRQKMGFKFNPVSIGAAVAAALTTGMAAWHIAATNATPGVQPNEYMGILFAVIPSIFGTFFHSGENKQ